jgi:hypothetical protein
VRLAEHRGPGARGREYEGTDDFDLDLDQRTRGLAGRAGRIIILGDGTEVLTESDDHEMFDHDEEDKDLESQDTGATGLEAEDASHRSEREGTPGPESATEMSDVSALGAGEGTPIPESAGEAPTGAIDKPAGDGDMPSKLFTQDRQ